MILICTDNGEMLLCSNNGEYKSYIIDSPLGRPIDSVFSFGNGFLVSVENSFLVFQNDEGDERALLAKDGERVFVNMNTGENASAAPFNN